MQRSKKLIIVSHCVLNQNCVVGDLARAGGAFRELVEPILSAGLGIVQLPCPELTYGGLNRPSLTKSQYDTPDYRKHCRRLALGQMPLLKMYQENRYQIYGLIGIDQSPSCAGEGTKGIFMEELLRLLRDNGMTLPILDVPGNYPDDSSFVQALKQMLK